VAGGRGLLLLGIWARGVQFVRGNVHLRSVFVEYWGVGCSSNQGKVGSTAFLLFGIGGVLGAISYKVWNIGRNFV